MNLQPTRAEHGALLVTCPNEATQYRLMAAVAEIAPHASASNVTSYDGFGWCSGTPSGYHVEVALTKSGEILDADEQHRILTAACARVNKDAAILEAANNHERARLAWIANASLETMADYDTTLAALRGAIRTTP